MPEFSITVQTVRVGTHAFTLTAADAESARNLVQAECDAGTCHCPPDWCTDDVASTLVDVRQTAVPGSRRD